MLYKTALALSFAPAVLGYGVSVQPRGAGRAAVSMQTGDGPGLQWGGVDSDPNFKVARLSDKLKEADIERRLEEEEIYKRENAALLKRQAKERKIELLEKIPDDTKAGTVDDFMFKEGVKDILQKLDYDLIGLKPVKSRVREIASLLVVDKMRLKLGLETSVPSLHMGFTGAPGTGKTTVALRMGQILQRMGYCRTGHVVVATRDDLVGQYVGHTAPKTKEMVKKAMGGILLVDEAYYLYNAANDRDYGQESIEILLNVMENNKEDIIVVLAGYKDRMDAFYGFIPVRKHASRALSHTRKHTLQLVFSAPLLTFPLLSSRSPLFFPTGHELAYRQPHRVPQLRGRRARRDWQGHVPRARVRAQRRRDQLLPRVHLEAHDDALLLERAHRA